MYTAVPQDLVGTMFAASLTFGTAFTAVRCRKNGQKSQTSYAFESAKGVCKVVTHVRPAAQPALPAVVRTATCTQRDATV